MAADEFQQAWQEHSSRTRVVVDADLLLDEVQRADRNFRRQIFWRDFHEVAVSLLMIPLWFYLGAVTSSPWTWYLTVPVLVWIAGFTLVTRLRRRGNRTGPNDALMQAVEKSLADVEHQIMLLRNVFWWYLLPPSISIMAFFTDVSWGASDSWWEFAGTLTFLAIVLTAVYATIYFVNQSTVRSQLQPRREELMTLLASLSEETSTAAAEGQVSLPALPFAAAGSQMPCASPARIAFNLAATILILVVIVTLVVVAANTDPYVFTGDGYPRRSPFAAVRWQQSQPEVKVNGAWFQLVSLDGVAAEEIVEFSQRTYGKLWRKRFEEDLVELLTRMNHPPPDAVTLVVRFPDSKKLKILNEVPMTYANRRAIRAAAQKRRDARP